MPSKKKKYNSRFPPARIKKIMQTDDEIGKVAAAVPVLISKCLEMFLVSILNHTGEVTKSRHAKTMSTSHLKECISTIGMFDFLKDVVANVAEMQNDEEPGTSAATSSEGAAQKTTRKRNTTQAKTPKKRVKLGADRHRAITEDTEPTESDNDSFGESSQESSNGLLSSSMSSHGHPSPNRKTTEDGGSSLVQKNEEKISFHIPLSTLMSIEKTDPASPSEESLSISKTLPASDESDEGAAAGSGVIDMSIKSAPSAPVAPQARCPVIVTNSSVVSMSKSLDQTATNGENRFPSAPQRPHVPPIPAPANMTHIYRPQNPAAPEKAPGEPGIPQGSMLSFLYSPFSGETPPPPFFSPHQQQPRVAHPSVGPHFAPPPPQAKTGPTQYPYNPMSAQLRRDPYPPPPEMTRPGPTKSDDVINDDDDDDYDA